ncbi:hypothetical protein [Martelella soudanensis]|uniref:hypothetical protein n=1 Tax=unclassified Martelella TaxID=2629616 RepID=UPI003530110A
MREKARKSFRRTANRRDFAIAPPHGTLWDRVRENGGAVHAVGKIGNIFAHRGIDDVTKGADDMALFDGLLEWTGKAGSSDLVFANFVEFDSLWGHRRDVAGYARALEAFDARMPSLLRRLRKGDLLVIAADHGNDPTWPGTDHTRERVPVLANGPGIAQCSLGLMPFTPMADICAAHLGLTRP